MILVIDTSSTMAVMGTIRPPGGGPLWDEIAFNSRETPVAVQFPYVVGTGKVDRVAVATGPGSFTGLRVGVSFGLGLAMGLKVPIVPLPTLDLQAARSDEPVTAVIDAGRGRYYFQVPGGKPQLRELAGIPAAYELVGNVADQNALVAAGHRFKPAATLRSTVEAAEILLRTAEEVPYRNLQIEYMQTFSAPRK